MRSPTVRRAGVVVWLTFSLGLVTTAFGVAYAVAAPETSVANEVLSAVIGSLGAGVVGAALSILITNAADRDGREDLVRILTQMLESRFTSDDNELSLLRTEWHHYHITSIDGAYVWRHMRYRSDQWSSTAGSLRYQHTISDGQGHTYRFTSEVGIRGGHVIILINGSAGEIGAQSSEVYPLLLVHGYRPYHCGIGTYRTWDHRNIIGRVILSRDPLAPSDEDGGISESYFNRLDEIWDTDFASQYDVLPPAQGATGGH